MKYIGHSVSHCIRDIISGTVQEDDVLFIVGRTKMASDDDINFVSDQYERSYWRADPTRGGEILRRFMKEGRIIQPRLESEIHPDLTRDYPLSRLGRFWQEVSEEKRT